MYQLVLFCKGKKCQLKSPECVYHPEFPENKKVFGADNLEVMEEGCRQRFNNFFLDCRAEFSIVKSV